MHLICQVSCIFQLEPSPHPDLYPFQAGLYQATPGLGPHLDFTNVQNWLYRIPVPTPPPSPTPTPLPTKIPTMSYKCRFFPQTIRDWNALPDSLISSAEDAEYSVAKFTSPVRAGEWLSVKARTKPNQTEPMEITEPAQPNLRKLTDNYTYRYRVLAPIPIRTLVLLTPSSLIIIIIIIRYIIIGFTDSTFSHWIGEVTLHSVILTLVFSMSALIKWYMHIPVFFMEVGWKIMNNRIK